MFKARFLTELKQTCFDWLQWMVKGEDWRQERMKMSFCKYIFDDGSMLNATGTKRATEISVSSWNFIHLKLPANQNNSSVSNTWNWVVSRAQHPLWKVLLSKKRYQSNAESAQQSNNSLFFAFRVIGQCSLPKLVNLTCKTYKLYKKPATACRVRHPKQVSYK